MLFSVHTEFSIHFMVLEKQALIEKIKDYYGFLFEDDLIEEIAKEGSYQKLHAGQHMIENTVVEGDARTPATNKIKSPSQPNRGPHAVHPSRSVRIQWSLQAGPSHIAHDKVCC